jgi:hypothetical protein
LFRSAIRFPIGGRRAGSSTDIDALKELYREVRLVRLFRATDALASGLAERRLGLGKYSGASDLVKGILDQEKLMRPTATRRAAS